MDEMIDVLLKYNAIRLFNNAPPIVMLGFEVTLLIFILIIKQYFTASISCNEDNGGASGNDTEDEDGCCGPG